MPAQDSRRVRISAPRDGKSATPPARRPAQIVTPDEVPAPRPVAPPATEGATSVFSRTEAEAQQRIVVPAPSDQEGLTVGNRDERAEQAPADEGGRRVVTWKRALAFSLVAIVLLIGGIIGWSYVKFRSIDRVDLAAVLASGNGTNYLIVGTDSREGIDPGAPDADAFLGEGAGAQGSLRSDTIMILRIDSDGTHTLSVPRDLFVTIAETGQQSRINAAFNGGPSRLIKTLDESLGLPIHHYLEINFVSFAGLVDALGGITIDFPNPAFDTRSGLNVPEAGPQKLDGSQAVAYVRSRYYTEVVDGQNRSDPTGDLGRVLRQQQFLAALGREVRDTRNPFTLAKVADAMAAGVKIDSDMGYFTAINLFLKLRGLDPEINTLPVTNFRAGRAAVLALVQPGANEVLARFGSAGARAG